MKDTTNWVSWKTKYKEAERDKEFFQGELEKANKRIIDLRDEIKKLKRKPQKIDQSRG